MPIKPLASALVLIGFMASASGADRMRAGLWETTTPDGGAPLRKFWKDTDVKVINGNEADARASIEATTAKMGAGWGTKDFKLQGNTMSYTMVMPGGNGFPVSATYHGDTYESMSPGGAISTSRRVGACT